MFRQRTPRFGIARVWAAFGRKLIAFAIIATAGGSLGVIAMNTEPYGEVDELVPPVVVSVRPARQLDSYDVRREFLGVVEARRESQVGFELAGELAEITADEGDVLEEGDIVARLNTEILKAERERLVAAQMEAKSALELAEMTRTRQQRLLRSNATSRQSWDEADKQRDSAAAAFKRAEATLAAIDTRIERSVLKAPFAAIVAERFVDEGQVVGDGKPVVYLLERVEPEVRIGITGRAVDTIKKGDRYELEIRDRLIPATVKAVLPVRGNGTRSVDIIFTLHAKLNGLRRGDLATLSLRHTENTPGFWLPLSALTESSRGLWSCYVAIELGDDQRVDAATHRLRKRQLEVVHIEADRVFARGTLNDSELVVTEGLQRLVQDQLVRIASGDTFSTVEDIQ